MSTPSPLRFGPDEIAACERLIELGLAEDLGRAGDVTSRALVPERLVGAARLVARRAGVLAGLEAAERVFGRAGAAGRWHAELSDGARLEPGYVLARVSGNLAALLAHERLALNFLQRLSGIATLTRKFVDAIAGLPCAIYDTRKTTPGWRALEKYAVRAGGGLNHRRGLDDAVLIKDNHLVAWRQRAAAGARSLAEAVGAARAAVPPGTTVEIEVDSIDQLIDALQGAPDAVLLDNMPRDQLRRAVALRNRERPQLVLEASGGITLETVRAVAEAGVDRISVGALTHSAPALDIALDFEECTA